MSNILIVDDEKNQIELLHDLLEFEGYNVFTALNINDAINELRKNSIDLVISDYKLKEGTGEDLLEKALFFYPDTMFIMLTAFGTIDTAVNCMKKGAFGFLTKPVNVEQLKETIIKALDNKVIRTENKNLKDIISSNIPQSEIIGSSPKIVEINFSPTFLSNIHNS